MLYEMEKLVGLSIAAYDGEIGKVKDVYFDDRRWAVRHLVVNAGSWLEERSVLISPFAVGSIDWERREIHVRLTMQQVRGSPPVDTDKPVSRQHEQLLRDYYGYPDYWGGSLLWGASAFPAVPVLPVPPAEGAEAAVAEDRTCDPHLRSALEVRGYHLHALDQPIGHLEDLLLDEDSWAVRYLVIDTRNWWPGKRVVIPPQWIRRLDWPERAVEVDVTRDMVRDAPPYDAALQLSREQEQTLHQHYRRSGYWEF